MVYPDGGSFPSVQQSLWLIFVPQSSMDKENPLMKFESFKEMGGGEKNQILKSPSAKHSNYDANDYFPGMEQFACHICLFRPLIRETVWSAADRKTYVLINVRKNQHSWCPLLRHMHLMLSGTSSVNKGSQSQSLKERHCSGCRSF
jgi:hypothetical protein